MAFAGLKKQINKANQYVTEKMGGAEGTKLDLDFMDMERKTDVTVELVEELQAKTKEYLQPNPTARAKMAAVKGISKLSGQAKSNTYPQPEGILADCMLTYGKKLGDDSIFANALVEMGDSLKQMADVKYSLDDNIKQNFLEPLHQLQTKDLKEVMHHRKKLQGRRLDFDCKKRRQAKDDEIRSAEEKFAESLQLAQVGMYNLLENDVEQVSQLVTFAEGLLDYHSQCADILRVLVEVLHEKREEASNRPKSEFVPKTLADLNIETLGSQDGMNGGPHFLNSNRVKNSHHHMYSSQQNLSTNQANNNYSHYQNHNHSNNNNNTSNFNRNKLYGSQQSLSSLSVRSAGGGGSRGGGSTGGSGGGGDNGNGNANSFMRPPSYGTVSAQHVSSTSTVDNWLNAWDQPSQASVVSAPTATATRTATNNNHGKLNSFGSNSVYKSTTSSTTTTSKTGTKFANNNFNDPWSASPLPSPMRSPARTPMPAAAAAKPTQPCCTALYDFEPENPGELGFKENDVITLIQRVDENWFEGSVNGRTGYFPQSYVQVTVPLP
ncbi:endophilin-A isoform X2 [Sabethes cyaneus]|uniref:endophilin-A isoform X2 n=1 Tax=Sabethes cyaneus TaxID=53552 RepID=UPI00237EC947|nr:endophilin-A isoform X2 [Sabethes cyaneus]